MKGGERAGGREPELDPEREREEREKEERE